MYSTHELVGKISIKMKHVVNGRVSTRVSERGVQRASGTTWKAASYLSICAITLLRKIAVQCITVYITRYVYMCIQYVKHTVEGAVSHRAHVTM